MNDKRRTYFNSFYYFVFCLVLHSCVNTITGNEDEDENNSLVGTTQITIVDKVIHQQIYNKNFETSIGLFAYLSSSSLNKSRYVDNQKMICNASGFLSTNEMFYPADKSKVNLVSYHPYSSSGFKSGTVLMDVETIADQSSSINYNLSDFMVAKSSSLSPSNKDVSMNHEHQFSQLSIILKATDDTDVELLRSQNPRLLVNDVFTNATFDFDNSTFSNYGSNNTIIPYGIWSVEGNKLVGKKCIIIPQQIIGSKTFITLSIGDKSYSIQLSDNYVLANGSSNEITILYSSKTGVANLITQINEWKEGIDTEVTPSENRQKQRLSIADFDFTKTSVYHVSSQGEIIAQVCKEYLLAENIANSAIVVYPVRNNVCDLQNGFVWEIYNSNKKKGGNASWDTLHNRLGYEDGDFEDLPFLFFDNNGDFQVKEPTSPIYVYINGKYLNDIRGSESIDYPVVKIGTQYWMREELRATKYIDGAAITRKTESTYSKTSAGYFLMNDYYFYNKSATISNKLAPNGWRISDYQDWDLLKHYLNGESSILKAESQWDESIYNASNITGFGAMPAGLFNKLSNTDESGYAFYKQYIAYWSMGITQQELSEKAILINYNSNEIKNASYTSYSGYSIRCIEN